MNRRNTFSLWAGLLLVSALGGCTEDADADDCATDGQCKGDRICFEGTCVSPGDAQAMAGGSAGDGSEGEDASGDGVGEGGESSTGPGGEDLPELACGYTGLAATAELEEGFSDGVPDALDLTFASNGGLIDLHGVDCAPSTPAADFEPGTSFECFEAYRCGACQVVVGKQPVEAGLFWFVVPVELRIPECAAFDGYYRWQDDGGESPDTNSGGTSTCEPGCVGGEICNDGTCECRDECVNPFGSSCCGGPFCAGDCAFSPCCT